MRLDTNSRRFRAIHVITILLVVIVSASPAIMGNESSLLLETQAQKPRYGGTMIYGLGANPPLLNPAISISGYTSQVASQIFNTLVKIDWNYSPIPELAASWSISPNGTIYTFNLLRNATWHDGTPFTSADVTFSFETIRKYHPQGASTLEVVKSVEAPDSYTVILKLNNPYPLFILTLGSKVSLPIIPKHLLQGTNVLNSTFNLNPIGTGPFMFKEFIKGDHITLVRNPRYFKKGLPYIDKIVYKIIPDTNMRILALKQGEADLLIYFGFPPASIEDVSKTPGLKIELNAPVGFGSQFQIHFNLRNQYLSNIKVRQAIAHAFNMSYVYEKALFNQGLISTGQIHQMLTWAKNPTLPKYEYNVDKANNLLDEAGFKRDSSGLRFSLSIIYDVSEQARTKASEILRENLKKVGIELKLMPLDVTTIYDKVYQKWDFDLTIQSTPSGPDPIIRSMWLHSKNVKPGTFLNCMGYKSGQVDRLLDQASVETNRTKMVGYLYEMQRIVKEDLPVLPFWDIPYPTAFRDNFAGSPYFLPGPLIYDAFEHVWWTKGSDVSPESVQTSIKAAEDQINSLKGQFYDVSDSTVKIEQAKKAYADGDYTSASKLAQEAPGVAKAPIALYAGIVILVCAVIAAVAFLFRRRSLAAKTGN